MRQRYAFVVSVFLLLASAVLAESKKSSSKWTVDDLVSAEQAADFHLSPKGDRAVWVKSTADNDKDRRVTNLVVTTLKDGSEMALTRGRESSSTPRWSPDGKLIAFLSKRPDPEGKAAAGAEGGPKSQLWVISPTGGEPWAVTRYGRDVTAFEWADPDTLVFAAQEEPSLYEATRKEKKDGAIVVDDEAHEPPVRLFSVSLKTKKVKRLTDNADRIAYLALSPDGKKAVAFREKSLHFVYDQRIRPEVYLIDLSSGEAERVLGKYVVQAVKWAPDGKTFYAQTAFTHDPVYLNATVSELQQVDAATGAVTKVDLGWDRGLADTILPTRDGLVALLANGVTHKLARFTRKGDRWAREWITGQHADHVFGLDLVPGSSTVVYAYSTASTPGQWYRATLNGSKLMNPAQITKLNEGWAGRRIAKSEVVHWKGARGDEVEGILYYPTDYEPGKKYPLVLMIHGGPSGADFDAWQERLSVPTTLVTQKGAFAFKVNYHGSSNYGLDWVESIGNGNYYDLEVPDIEAGVDSLVSRALVDPGKLAVSGWSNGAILTIALTVTTNRYKAASAGAGDVDWASDWGNCAFGASFDNYYFGKSPLEDPQLYIRKSPFYRLDRVTTPTLIFFGTEDRQVPTQQGWMHYRALQQLGKTDVRFILFPGEEHGPRKLSNQRTKLNEELAWWDKYLFLTAESANEALKPGSPLALALKLKKARGDGARYGVVTNGVLVPETVDRDGLQVGRIEVTRAQFGAFDPSFRFAAGTENYPVTGISADQARAYCEWLSKAAAAKYRLPNEEEADKLYGGDGSGENTLDHWAGYAVNPDDAAKLQKSVAELGDGALIREAGTFRGDGEDEPVFDLGGNAAEWVTLSSGGAEARGGSADTPADAEAHSRHATPSYIGFRVVKE